MTAVAEFRLGHPNLTAADCCGKPGGCTNVDDGCLYLSHPWKRALLFDDPTVRCQAASQPDGVRLQCVLLHRHDGPCQTKPTPREVTA